MPGASDGWIGYQERMIAHDRGQIDVGQHATTKPTGDATTMPTYDATSMPECSDWRLWAALAVLWVLLTAWSLLSSVSWWME